MLFQRTIFTDKNTIKQQLHHLQSEIFEVAKAIDDEDWNAAADELVDLQHSADTALRILQEKYGADAYGAYSRVNINNTKRGYYNTINFSDSAQ